MLPQDLCHYPVQTRDIIFLKIVKSISRLSVLSLINHCFVAIFHRALRSHEGTNNVTSRCFHEALKLSIRLPA